ncbi:MAG: DegT/DnrJ/EryC1/StrS family aminotransferase [Firmicutes bacterium]|nr:DegT/DnrJ/EryC1/StrS family aminotransferase [Bacillota bacterium]
MKQLPKQIPFHKPYITEDEISEVVDSLRSGWLTMGPKTAKFEEEFQRYVGSRHAVAVNSCTAAIHLALRAIHLEAGDEVIMPTMAFTATGEAAHYFGAKPVIVDIDIETLCIDVNRIERAITPKTKAIIPVHHGGQPCDMDAIIDLAEYHGLQVIEDAAHALPAWYRGRKIGSIGHITCFSFYATKTLATGEGGMATTENNEWACRMKTLRLHGISRDAWLRNKKGGSWYYEVLEAGHKYNMTDIQAGLGLAQLSKVEWMWNRRRSIAEKYSLAFKDSELITPPSIKTDRVSSWHLYIIKLNLEALRIDRAGFIEALKAEGIGASVHFIPLHKHPFYINTFGYDSRDFPDAEWAYERIVSLPIYPGMDDADVDRVIEVANSVALRYKR